MLKRICLFMAVISFSALYAINALAQSCDLAPTCAELGFTQTTSECSGKKTLICPFDKTAVFCGSSSDNGPFGSGSISFQFITSSNRQTIGFEASGGDLWVDWGDGTFDKSNNHEYATGGTYTIKIYGTITDFKATKFSSWINELKLLSLDLASIKKMDLSYFSSLLTGTIPTLPKNLIDGSNMFKNCSGLTGSIPNLPPNLIDGTNMFRGCTSLTGTIPALPDSLTNGEYMFYNCSGLSGSIPPLPDSLTNGEAMFNKSSGLTGLAPKKPDNLISYGGIFGFTPITNDGSWPDDAWFF